MTKSTLADKLDAASRIIKTQAEELLRLQIKGTENNAAKCVPDNTKILTTSGYAQVQDIQRHAVAEIPSERRKVVSEDNMKAWAGGSLRSKKMPDWWMSPWRAWRGMLTRFTIGMKYGINNWKKTLAVPRDQWHDGEPGPGKNHDDQSALGFVRQFYGHGQEHFYNAVDLADKPVGAVSEKGDTLIENLYAYLWNAATLVEYAIENEDMFREAFSMYSEGHPKRRQDLQQLLANVGLQKKLNDAQALIDPTKWNKTPYPKVDYLD